MLLAAPLTTLLPFASTMAAPATCRDYADAQGADRAIIEGFITGFVAARLEGRSVVEVDGTAQKVRALTTRFCIIHPDEHVVDVIGGLADIATGYVAPR